jgi:hypothetical protein
VAIKNKGRSKNRQVARPPRRTPVEVKPPLFVRRWVQLTLAFVTGVAVVLFVGWIWASVQQMREDDRTAQELDQQRAALQQWQTQVEQQLGTVGQIQQQPLPPVIAPQVAAAAAALADGKPSQAAGSDLRSAGKALADAADALDAFDLSGTIKNKGFDVGQADRILTSRTQFVNALRTYRQVALLSAEAIDAQDSALSTTLGTSAKALTTIAEDSMNEAWRLYSDALTGVGLQAAPIGNPGGIPGVTGSGS